MDLETVIRCFYDHAAYSFREFEHTAVVGLCTFRENDNWPSNALSLHKSLKIRDRVFRWFRESKTKCVSQKVESTNDFK